MLYNGGKKLNKLIYDNVESRKYTTYFSILFIIFRFRFIEINNIITSIESEMSKNTGSCIMTKNIETGWNNPTIITKPVKVNNKYVTHLIIRLLFLRIKRTITAINHNKRPNCELK